MPDYFVFWDELAGRIRIHRADCRACKYGKDLPGKGSGRRTSDWRPADTYGQACEIVAGLQRLKPVFKRSAKTDCGLCHPERQAGA